MIEKVKTKVHVLNTVFQVTPKPLIVHVSSVEVLKLEDCSPIMHALSDDPDYVSAYCEHLDDLHITLALDENLPHRVEYDPDEYIVMTDFCLPHELDVVAQ